MTTDLKTHIIPAPMTGKEAHAICVIEKGIRPLAVPPAKGLFLSAHFPLTSSKMPSRIHLKLSHKTKIKKGIE